MQDCFSKAGSVLLGIRGRLISLLNVPAPWWPLAGLAVLLACTTHANSPYRPPNIVLIISDDHAWTDYGFMGHPIIRTPNLDQLAKTSLFFPNGYVPTSLCSPSLMSIITGLYPVQHRITGNEPPIPLEAAGQRRSIEYQNRVQEMIRQADDLATLPKQLAKRGYASFQTGKWWMGHYSRGGFTEGMTHGDPARGGRHGDEGLKIGREGLDPIFDFIRNNSANPFFVWYAPFLPHTPHTPPERLLSKYRTETDSEFVAKYWAMIEWFDESCGALLDFLKSQSLQDNTLVIYVTDNGWIQRPDQNGYAPKSKRSPYNGGLKTPILMHWPGNLEPEVIPYPASSIDLAPTILKACGLEPDRQMQGLDLRDLDALRARKYLFGDVYLHNAVDLYRPERNLTHRWGLKEDWKLILPHPENLTQQAGESGSGQTELYYLPADPSEQVNLAASHPERVKEMTNALESWWAKLLAKDN